MALTSSDYLGSTSGAPSYDHTVMAPPPRVLDEGKGGRGQSGVHGQYDVYYQPQYTQQDVLDFKNMAPQQVFYWQDLLARAGMLSTFTPGNSLGGSTSAYATALKEADDRHMSVEDFLNNQIAQKSSTAGSTSSRYSGGGSSGGGGGSSTTSSSSSMTATSNSTMRAVNLTSRASAENILRSALQMSIGRAPSDEEVKDFARALQKKERANPTVTKQHSVTKSNQSSTTTSTAKSSSTSGSSTSNTTGSTTTKQGNVDAEKEARDFGTSTKPLRREHHAYQGMQYYNVIADMLGMGT